MSNKKRKNLSAEDITDWERSVLKRMGERIKKIGMMSAADIPSLNNISDVMSDMLIFEKELKTASKKNTEQAERFYTDELTTRHSASKRLYAYRKKPYIPYNEHDSLQSVVRTYAKMTAEALGKLTDINALYVKNKDGKFVTLKKGYYDVLNRTAMRVAGGTFDIHTALRESIRQLGDGGLRVNYGNGVTRRLDTVVRQEILQGAKQVNAAYNELIGDELGCDGIEIDYHANPRPSHAFMQGKQYVLGRARWCNGVYFESADEALKRLEDYNCRHYKTPIICGVSEPRYSKKELAELKARDEQKYNIGGRKMTGYEAAQEMRKLETSIREQKGIKAIAQASGDKIETSRCDERIKKYQDKYAEISEATGIEPDKKRMTLTKAVDGDRIKAEKEFSPRKNKTGDHSVKWDKVQTPEYENKFSQLSDNEKVVSSAKTRANWCLNNRDGKSTEEIYAVSLKDGREIGRITEQTKEYSVARTKAFDTALKNADEADEKVLLLHNHPRGLPPSISDINALVKNKNVSGTTIGHDGSVYYYTRPNKEIPYADYQVLLRKYKEYSNVTSMEKALEELQEKYGFTIKKL